ncbi:DUF2283 domain-containing protein [Candidatus Scalindua japonica]|nr:DUF2283 domain-containing protein [Candidatus Scalindua japonica]
MKVKYFSDTDTALVEFADNEIVETKEISENVYVDLDSEGNLINTDFLRPNCSHNNNLIM